MKMNDRERAFEDRFAHDEELHFKVRAKRNKMAGLWAAQVMGKNKDDAEHYALSIVNAGIAKDNLRERLVHDFQAAGINISGQELDAKIQEFVSASRNHFMNEK